MRNKSHYINVKPLINARGYFYVLRYFCFSDFISSRRKSEVGQGEGEDTPKNNNYGENN